MATQQTDCEAALKQILSLLNQNNATKGFQTSQGVLSPPIVNPVSQVPALDDRALQALIAAYTGAASSTTQSTQGKAFAGTTAQPPVDESVSRVVAAMVPGIVKAMQQEKAYQASAGTGPAKEFDWLGAAQTAVQIGGLIASFF